MTEFARLKLSDDLEDAFFRAPLKKREIEALKERCETYQNEEDRGWKGYLYHPYSQYFGLLSALKLKSVLRELDSYGYLNALGSGPIKLFDFGSGTLGATLGAMDFLKETGRSVESLTAIDQDTGPSDWAANQFAPFLPPKKKLLNTFPDNSDLSHSIIFAIDVFNEWGLMEQRETVDQQALWFKSIEKWMSQMTDTTLLILIEPASKKINRQFLHLRNILKEKMTVLLPCTHQEACPALLTDDWCHEDRDYVAPSKYWNLVHSLGFQRTQLSFSVLCLGKQASVFTPLQARVVSRQLKSKGRCDKWVCAQGKRWKASIMKRHRSEENENYFESKRGHILDCSSTGLKIPD